MNPNGVTKVIEEKIIYRLQKLCPTVMPSSESKLNEIPDRDSK